LREENNIRDARAAIARVSIDDNRYPTLEEKLQKVIEQITSLHEIGALPKGDFAMLDPDDPDYLVIQGVTGFSDYIYSACKRIHIPSSNCLCAQVIRENRDLYSLHSNHNHNHGVQDPKRPTGVDHGHAILVLRNDSGKAIGVQNLYIRSPYEETDPHKASTETEADQIPRGTAFLDDCRREVEVLISRFNARRELEEAHHKQNELLQLVMRDHEIIQNMMAAIVVFDDCGEIISFNPAFCDSIQQSEEAIYGNAVDFTEVREQLHQLFIRAQQAEDGAYVELVNIRRSDGGLFKANLGIRRIRVNDVKDEYICIFTDAAKAIEGLEELAFTDALTGLPNRLLFDERLRQALHESLRDRTGVALFALDASFLKWYNDSLGGHAAGDAMLKEVALRIKSHLRTSDTVARIGGDEFGIILRDIAAPTALEAFNRKILDTLNQPFVYNGIDACIRAGIGVTIFNSEEALSPEELFDRADTAMYVGKFRGKGPQLMKKRDVTLEEIRGSQSHIAFYRSGMQRPEVSIDEQDPSRLRVMDEFGQRWETVLS
ncbi:MAG: GGDEF domain-containing protein, partial [Gammaproteobacteria bacterium]|nr:GGDEF domain-containing protein [Gammaproteobacteria bacterium]